MPAPLWAVAALLAVEYFSISLAFDSQPLSRRADGWAVAGNLGWLTVIAASTAIGVALAIYSDRLRVRDALTLRRFDRAAAGLLLAHLASFALVWVLSALIFSPSGPPTGPPAAWLLAWTTLVIASLLLALAAVVSPSQLIALVTTAWPVMLGGAAIGLGAWLAGQASAYLWWPLGPVTLRAVGLSLDALLTDAVWDPGRALVGSEHFQVIVAPVCSGFEGVGLMTVLVAAYLILARQHLRFPAALWLIPISIVAAWVANVARLVALVLVGTFVSPAIAEGGFHARAGWVLFSALTLLLVFLVERAHFFTREPADTSFDNPTAAYLLPFLALVATALVTGLATTHVDVYYGVRLLPAIALLYVFRRHYGSVRPVAWSWTAVVAGVLAGVVFVALAPRPLDEVRLSWHEEWNGLPAWGRAVWVLVRSLGAVVVVPVVEELAFRGYLLRRLVSREFETVSFAHLSWGALLVSSAAFGGIHHGWLGGTLAGLLFAAVQIRGNGIGHAIAAHVAANAVVTFCVLGLGWWWLWA